MKYLTIEQLLRIHARSVAQSGGDAGVRDISKIVRLTRVITSEPAVRLSWCTETSKVFWPNTRRGDQLALLFPYQRDPSDNEFIFPIELVVENN